MERDTTTSWTTFGSSTMPSLVICNPCLNPTPCGLVKNSGIGNFFAPELRISLTPKQSVSWTSMARYSGDGLAFFLRKLLLVHHAQQVRRNMRGGKSRYFGMVVGWSDLDHVGADEIHRRHQPDDFECLG
jgi:hypothetical protein